MERPEWRVCDSPKWVGFLSSASDTVEEKALSSVVSSMSTAYMEKKGEEEDYLPQNDEFIPPTNFAVIENGLYRSTCIPSLSYPGAFPVKRNFAFLRHLGIRSILFALLRVLTHSVLVPEEYPEDSLKFLKRCNIRLFKYPLEGNKVAL